MTPKNLIDMHIHTTSSDGEYDCLTMVKKIITEDTIKTFSFTNHDNIDDNLTMKQTPIPNLTYINGCELTAEPITIFKRKNSQLHILGYDFDLENKELNELLELRRQYDTHNFKIMVKALEKQGIYLSSQEIEQIINRPNFGRPDLVRLMINKGIVKSTKEAFDKYLINAKESTQHTHMHIYDEEVIQTIKKANGYASLAHPISLKLNQKDLEEYIEYLHTLGLDAIEVYHPTQSNEYRQMLLDITEKQELLVSGGSDYHGPVIKPDINLGTGRNNNLKIKSLSLVDKIQARKQQF